MRSTLARWYASDVGYSFRTSPVAIVAASIAFICVFCAVFAGWVAPHNPFDLTTLVLSDARLPPAWEPEGSRKYLLGTDDQGRDILSTKCRENYIINTNYFSISGLIILG